MRASYRINLPVGNYFRLWRDIVNFYRQVSPARRVYTFAMRRKYAKTHQREKGHPFGLFPFSLWKPFSLPPNRGPPPRGKRAVSQVIEGEKAVPATLALNLKAARTTLGYRICKPPRIYARRRTASGRKMGKIPKKGKKTAPNGCLPFLWHVFAYFRRVTKVGARRTGES